MSLLSNSHQSFNESKIVFYNNKKATTKSPQQETHSNQTVGFVFLAIAESWGVFISQYGK